MNPVLSANPAPAVKILALGVFAATAIAGCSSGGDPAAERDASAANRPTTGSNAAVSTDGDCARLRAGDPMTAYPDLQCAENVHLETLDCRTGQYVHLTRPVGGNIEGIIGLTADWRPAEPRSTGGRTPWAFANCQESG